MTKHTLSHRIILLLLLAIFVIAVQPVWAQDDTIPSPTEVEQVIELTNLARVAEGRPPLAFNETLALSAQSHSEDMAVTDFFAHYNPATFTTPTDRIAAAGYDGIATGENLAAGSRTPAEAVQGWLESPGHRANIMSDNFREIGTGYVFEEDDRYPDEALPYQHYWTQNFGTRADYFPLVINNEAYATTGPDVSLYVYGDPWAQEMRFRNNDGSFSSWEPYAPTRNWTLPSSDGLHQVSVELRNGTEIRTAEDSIYLDSTGTAVAIATFSDSVTSSQLSASTSNEYIQIGVRDDGRFVIGTTDGDPTTSSDDNRQLMYGYLANPGTSFTTLRTGTTDIPLYTAIVISDPAVRGDAIEMAWQTGDLVVEQTLSPAINPYTNRADTVAIRYEITNRGDTPQEAGLRLMLDVQVGNNDGAPYLVAGHDTATSEAEFFADNIPIYWRAFESETFATDSLKAQGILWGGVATPPDRFIIADWPLLADSIWDYAVNPEEEVTNDSAVALYWDPVEIAPGASITYIAYYGLGGTGGGEAWIDTPTSPTCDNRTVPVTLWINNGSDTDFANGTAVISLPVGLELSAGETADKPIGNVPIGQARSVSWLTTASDTAFGLVEITTTTSFVSGSDDLVVSGSIDVADCVAVLEPTAVPSATPTPPPTATPMPPATATPPPTFTPAPTPTPIAASETIVESTAPPWWQCFPWWLLIPLLLLLLLFLLLVFTPLGNRLRDRLQHKSWLCRLLAFLTLLYILFLAALIARPLLADMCRLDRVYFWRIAENEPQGIYFTEFGVGGNPEPFTAVNETADCVGCHSISLTSSRLAAVTDTATGQIVVHDLAGDSVVVPEVNASYMVWSPDGNQIALSLNDEDIYILDVRNGVLEPLDGASEPDRVETMPSWSPDGQSIAFVRPVNPAASGFNIESPSDIYVVPATGGSAAPLAGASGDGFNYYPAYSPDGRWIAFTRHTTGQTTYADDASDIYLVPASGGTALLLAANSPMADSWPGWSEDGQWLAFSTNREDANFDIYVTKIDETGASGMGVPLPGADAFGVFEHLPRWAPPEPLSTWWERLLPLWPWLIPLIILLWLVCRDKTPPPSPSVNTPPPPPLRKEPLPPPDYLETWSPPVVWEPIPTLILGLGGTGRHILTQIKKNLRDTGGEHIAGKANQVRLLLLDIASYEQRAGQSAPVQFAGVELDYDTEVVEFGENLGQLRDSLQQDADLPPELRHWFPLSTYKRTAGGDALDLRSGTQGRRPPVRAALVRDMKRGTENNNSSSKLWRLLRQAAHDTRTQDGRVRIIIVSSLAGGTGSAIIADMAYLARRAASEVAQADGTSVEAYLVSDAAFAKVATNTRRMATNTFATLRELERFQMAQGRPFRMVYDSKRVGDAILGGLVKSRLLDEVYLMDGHRTDRPLGNETPSEGVFASIADTITLFLDKASRGHDMRQHRRGLQGLANDEQNKLGRMVVAGAGSFTYRLPMYDIMERLKVRYARELMRTFLMGAESGEPRLSTELCQEKALPNESELALSFLLNKAGYAGAPNIIRRIGQVAETGWRPAMVDDVLDVQLGDTDAESVDFRNYLGNALEVILNGQSDSELITARCGKIAYALDFLDQTYKWLQTAVSELSYMNTDVDGVQNEQLVRFKQLPALYQAEVEKAKSALQQQSKLLSERLRPAQLQGWRTAATGATALYEWLLEREKQLQTWREQMDAVLVRRYLHDDALVDDWFKTYLNDPANREDDLRRFHWQSHPDGGVQLCVRTQEDHLLAPSDDNANSESVISFARALLDLAEYRAREIWEKETLADVLAQTALHSEQLAETSETMWRNSGPLIRYQSQRASQTVESGVLGVNYKVTAPAKPLAELLSRQLPAERKLVSVDITDPYTLLLVRTADILPITALPLEEETRREYRQFDSESTAVFTAEHDATNYEQQMGRELKQTPRVLHPAVVTGLNEPEQTRLFALAYASHWIQQAGSDVTLAIPGQPATSLANDPNDSLHPIVLAFVQFAVWEDLDAVQALQEAVKNAGENIEEIWRAWTRSDWANTVGGKLTQNNDMAASDLAVVIALLVRKELRYRMSGRQ